MDASEEDHIFEYLNLLFLPRPEVSQSLGARARQWVERECSWDFMVARRYADFLEAVVEGKEWPPPSSALEEQETKPVSVAVPGEYIAGWTKAEDSGRGYVETHMTRLERTLAITPAGTRDDRVLEMGAYLHITPAAQNQARLRAKPRG